MRTHRPCGSHIAALAVATATSLFGPPGVKGLSAQEARKAGATGPALADALAVTRTRGAATVAVITAADEPASVRLWNEFCNGTWVRAQRGLVQVVNVSKDSDPELVRSLNVTQYPTALVYGRGPQGVSQLGTVTGCATADALVARLRALGLGPEAPGTGTADPAVTPTSFGGDIHPSQQFAPTPTVAPQGAYAAPPQPQSTQSVPAFVPQAVPASTAGLIQMPSQNFVIQQAPPQVFLTPTQGPIVYVPQAMTNASALSAPAPASNMFLPSAVAASVPVATAAAAPAPMAAAVPMMAPAALTANVAMASATPVGAALTSQTMALPATQATTRIRVRGPGLLQSSLARLGERMTLLGRARIETVQETTLASPFSQPSGGPMATITTTSAAPVATTQSVPAVPTAQPQQVCAPPPPLPTPQNAPQKHSWFHH